MKTRLLLLLILLTGVEGVRTAECGEYRTILIRGSGHSGHMGESKTRLNQTSTWMTRYFTDDEIGLDLIGDNIKWVMRVTPTYLECYNAEHEKQYTERDLKDDVIRYKVLSWIILVDVPRDLKIYRLKDTQEMRFVFYHFGLNEAADYQKTGKLPMRIKRCMDRNLFKFEYLTKGE